MTIGKDQGIVGHVFDTAEGMLCHNEIPEDSPLYGSDEATGMKISSQLVIPINPPGKDPFGCIQLVNKNGGTRFDEEDLRLGNHLTALISLDIEDKGYGSGQKTDVQPMVSLRGVVKEFASGDQTFRVLKGIDLDIFPKEFLVILGESGCGRTTMLNIIGGMDSLTDGQILVDGKDFSHPNDKELTEYRRNEIGFIFQSYALMPNLSALENLQFVAEISKNPSSPEEALSLVGLTDRAGNFPLTDERQSAAESLCCKGASEEEITSLLEVEGVQDAEGTIEISGSNALFDGQRMETNIYEAPERIGKSIFTGGREPSAEDECALTEQNLRDYGIEIGDTIEVMTSPSTPFGDVLKNREFTVTGTVQ